MNRWLKSSSNRPLHNNNPSNQHQFLSLQRLAMDRPCSSRVYLSKLNRRLNSPCLFLNRNKRSRKRLVKWHLLPSLLSIFRTVSNNFPHTSNYHSSRSKRISNMRSTVFPPISTPPKGNCPSSNLSSHHLSSSSIYRRPSKLRHNKVASTRRTSVSLRAARTFTRRRPLPVKVKKVLTVHLDHLAGSARLSNSSSSSSLVFRARIILVGSVQTTGTAPRVSGYVNILSENQPDH